MPAPGQPKLTLPPLPNVKVGNESAWNSFRCTLWALFVRETKTRFGRYQLGLAWALIDALGQVALFSFIFGFFLNHTAINMPYPVFIATGYLPLSFLTGIVNSFSTALRSNQGLLVYQRVKPLDPFLARLLLEAVIMTVALTVFLGGCAWFGAPFEFYKPLHIGLGLFSLVLIAAGLGLLIGLPCYRHPELEKIVPIAMRPLVFLSCVLHPLASVPENYQRYFLYNPLVTVVETCRSGLFPGYATAQLDIWYPAMVGVFSLALGLSFYWRFRNTLYSE